MRLKQIQCAVGSLYSLSTMNTTLLSYPQAHSSSSLNITSFVLSAPISRTWFGFHRTNFCILPPPSGLSAALANSLLWILLNLIALFLVLNVCAPFVPFSDSRSSLSEGQLLGSFSDGELLRFTPRGSSALEEGELPPAPPSTPPAQEVAGCQEETAAGSADRNWSRCGDPRQNLTLLMSAQNRSRGNRASARGGRKMVSGPAGTAGDAGAPGAAGVAGAAAITAAGEISGVSSDQQQRGARPQALFSATAEKNDFGAPRGAGSLPSAQESYERLAEEIGGFEIRDVGRGDANGSSLSGSGCSLEPGQAYPPMRRSWQGCVSQASAGGVERDIHGERSGGQIGLGPSWLRLRQVASEDTSSSVGEASSGAELGEIRSAFVECEGGRREGSGGRGEDHALRPLVALNVDAGAPDRGR